MEIMPIAVAPFGAANDEQVPSSIYVIGVGYRQERQCFGRSRTHSSESMAPSFPDFLATVVGSGQASISMLKHLLPRS
jgi:hypothetical protein